MPATMQSPCRYISTDIWFVVDRGEQVSDACDVYSRPHSTGVVDVNNDNTCCLMTNRDWTCPTQTVDYVPVSGEDVTDVCERYADWWVVEADRCKGVGTCYQHRTCLHMFCQPVTAVVYRNHSFNNTLHHYSKHGVKEINTELSYIIYL